MNRLAIQQAFDLAVRHHQAGRLQEAEKIYRQILTQQPEHVGAIQYLGVMAHQTGQSDLAVQLIRRAIAIQPNYLEAHINLGSILNDKGRYDEAIAALRQAVALDPKSADAHNNLGNAFKGKGQFDSAVAAYRRAVALNAQHADALSNLGNALTESGQCDEAVAVLCRAIALRPKFVEAHYNLGNALRAKGQLDDAVAVYRQAIALNPKHPEAHGNLANALSDMGQVDEAIAAFRQAIAIRPSFSEADSNLVYSLHFSPRYDAGMVHEEHRRWNRQHAEALGKSIQPHTNSRDPDRPLRIGYVSPDFRAHPVGRFLLPPLAQHDRDHFKVFCYSDVLRPDHVTGLLQRHADEWRNTAGLSDEQLGQLIREDKIDVLVDLTMHMARNRMLLFARKPAPIQVTYLAYCSTTGLSTIDYRLTDPNLDPPGSSDAHYSEKSVWLPETYWCYPLHQNSPEIGPPPALSMGAVTFGCLNNFCKVSMETLDLWIELMRATPKSRLILHAPEGSHRQRLRDRLQKDGIDPERLEFVGKVPMNEYFKLYEKIDIALDPFPCNGGTTTCDALWMGVPVVTLKGRTAVGRAGTSILSNVGVPELIAQTSQQYVQIAAKLAGDLPRLTELRRALRDRMRASRLMDAPRFARNIESCYRQMWRDWCGSGSR
jgi:protein O-GlcNAc transferase